MVSSVSSSSLASSWASQIFSKVDTKNQGYIDKASLQSAFDQIDSSSTSSSSASSSSNVDQLFSSLDSNSDGKVSKDELTSSLQKVAGQLNSAFDQMRMGMAAAGGHGGPGGPGAAGGPPPGPPPGQGGNDGDSGFTKDQLTQQLSDIGSSDSKRSELISSVVNNFDKADSNGDGKVSRQEAMAFDQSQKTTAATSGTASSGASGSGTSSGSNAGSEASVMQQIVKLMQAYGGDSSSAFSLLSNSLSVSA